MNHARPCPKCSLPNSPSNRFCGGCGAALPTKFFTPGVTALFIVLGLTAAGAMALAVVAGLANPRSFNTPEYRAAAPSPPPPPPPAATPAPTPKSSMEVMLATIDEGAAAREDDLAVKRFRFLLENIGRKTRNTKDQIGDMTVNAQKLLRDKYGKAMTLRQLMEDADRAMPEGSQMKWDYAEIITAVVILEGQS
jgi:pyruvate/2-oxoglutarate dehydrogenase complex dihydrolipoamide acyltransferase (E2) component